jgi:hypothetical protein
MESVQTFFSIDALQQLRVQVLEAVIDWKAPQILRLRPLMSW